MQPACIDMRMRCGKQERQKLRDRLGISSPADFGRLLQLLPHELIDFMRVGLDNT